MRNQTPRRSSTRPWRSDQDHAAEAAQQGQSNLYRGARTFDEPGHALLLEAQEHRRDDQDAGALVAQYSDQDRIFLSWDAASWHASKAFISRVDAINGGRASQTSLLPRVELAPLPSGAQFLNVIESVFSGMARAVIHNSDYSSVDECKRAIDRYFRDRNAEFTKNPKRAGKVIWGKERELPVFSEANNCKDPRYR
jgi:hypothetical protein